MTYGWRVWGLGVIAIAMLSLVWGTFNPGQPVPEDLPAYTVLCYVAALFMLAAGAAVEWRRTLAWGSAALTAYYGLIVIVLMYGHEMPAHYAEFSIYESLAIQLAIPAAGLIVFAASAELGTDRAARFTRVGQLVFGGCALVFGAAHFIYMNLTAPLVPKWLPFSQEFWGYVTGVCHIAAGLAILTGVQARLAAVLLTVMFAGFTPLVHLPMLFADPSNHWIWSENATNLVLTGAAWIVAGSLSARGAVPRRS
jgi:uncharacterized membrane protein